MFFRATPPTSAQYTLSSVWTSGGGGGGGAGWGGDGLLYMAKYGCACRIAPVFSAARYMIGPLFQQKVYEWPDFSGFLCERPHFSDILVYAHIFGSEIFRGCLYPLGITWIDCDICVITSKKWVQKVKGQYMNRSTFWMIKYMNESVFSKARYMNGVGFEILARTPAPLLPLSYPTPPPPPPPPEVWTSVKLTR